MNREQMVAKGAIAVRKGTGYPELAAKTIAAMVVDALLPQVSTVEELEALHPRALVLKDFSNRAQTEEAGSLARDLRYLGDDFLPENPLTVVWQP